MLPARLLIQMKISASSRPKEKAARSRHYIPTATGDRLEIRNGGSLIGTVTTKRISIEDGAHFKASIDMDQIERKSRGDHP